MDNTIATSSTHTTMTLNYGGKVSSIEELLKKKREIGKIYVLTTGKHAPYQYLCTSYKTEVTEDDPTPGYDPVYSFDSDEKRWMCKDIIDRCPEEYLDDIYKKLIDLIIEHKMNDPKLLEAKELEDDDE